MNKHLAHELIVKLKPDSKEYEHCVSSIKFDLGEYDDIIAMSEISTKEFFELPAPICLFQIVHGMDVHMLLALGHEDGSKSWKRFGKLRSSGQWQQSCVEVVITQEHSVYVNDLCKGVRRPELLEEVHYAFDKREAFRLTEEHYTVGLCIYAAASLEVFSCSNVEQVEHKPPKQINESRLRKGKVPFFSWKTLHISGVSEQGEAKTEGGHNSPRLHFRRGHIRRLNNGRRTWVRSCLVGDKQAGFSGHDYEVRSDRIKP